MLQQCEGMLGGDPRSVGPWVQGCSAGAGCGLGKLGRSRFLGDRRLYGVGGAGFLAPLLFQHLEAGHWGHPGPPGHHCGEMARPCVWHRHCSQRDQSLPWGHATHWAQLVPLWLQATAPAALLHQGPITHQLLEIRWRLP